MKKIYLILVVSLLCFVSEAQIVNIPDANFKIALLNYQPVIDTNNDGEIQVSEAQAVITLNLFGYYNVNDITGLEAFTNLENLYFNIYSISTLDVSMLINLKVLNCSSAISLTSINVTNLNSLLTLNLSNCNLSNLDLTGCNNITNLYCSGNKLTTLNISNLTNLQHLDCSSQTDYLGAGITNLNLSGLNNLTNLNCSWNNLTNLDASNLLNLQNLNCSNQNNSYGGGITNLSVLGSNNLINLNCSDNVLTSLNVSNLVNLQNLNCSDQKGLTTSNPGISNLDTSTLTSLTHLNVSNNIIAALNLSNCNQLIDLNCSDNQLTNLNLNNLINLLKLNCSTNQITNLDITNNVNLTNFGCNSNLLTSLDLSNSSNLLSLDFSANQISNIDVSNLTNLKSLACGSNQLSSLNISNLINLGGLYCYGNQLSVLDVSNLGYLTNIVVGNNLFTSLDFSSTGLASTNDPYNSLNILYDFNSNTNLTYINLKNGKYLGSLNFIACPNLQYICADDFNIQTIQQTLSGSFNVGNVQVNSYCSFIPGGINNKIIGTVTLDTNNNGCDTNDIHPLDLKMNITDGTTSGATFCNANGGYSFFNQIGNFTLTPQFQNNYFNVNPVSATLNFPLLDGSTQTQDFCITPNGVHNDVDITILPLGTARPGFDANYQLIYKNKGNQTLSGSVNLTFNDAVLDFVSANSALDTQSINNMGWNYTNLLPFESRTINFTLNLNGPMEIPAVNINDVLNYVATVNPIANDETPNDNTFELNQTVVGSFDPNDKVCLEGETISPAKVSDYLHYMIRFQNSGTAPAENIVVKDMIDASKFDINTLQLTSTSHPQKTKITGNKVEFIFEGINLPAEVVNEPQSHGYVAFKIKTKDNLVIGNTVSNTADIYFDYNFPIITNTATTTVTALGINQFENKSVSFYPNPTKNSVTISANDNITSIQLFDVQRRLIETKLNNTTETKLDLSKQLSGIYFAKVYTEKGIKTEKIIKE